MNCTWCDCNYDNQIEFLCSSCGGYEKVSLFSEVPTYTVFFQNLVNKTATLMDNLDKKGISNIDIRRTKLGAFNIISLATVYDIADYDNDIRYDDSRIPKTIKKSNPNVDHDFIQKIVESIDIRNRQSYLVVSLFQFENLFTELAKKRGFTGNETYSKVVTHLVNNLPLKKKNEILYGLLLPSYVRNTLHSQGVYKKKPKKEFKVKNILFTFEEGKSHDYTSWRHLIFYFDNMIDIVDEILECDLKK
ncbi:MAG: hypothetical protein ACREAK_05715 [Nitrosarchaeum sp.]